MLKDNYFIADFKAIVIDGEKVYVIYPYTTLKLHYNPSYQWSFSVYGETSYSQAKYFVKLVDKLEGYFLGDINND